MGLADAFGQALRLLWAHKGRAVLTLFGLVWGTASVVFLTGWGQGVRVMLEEGFFKTGKNAGQFWAGRVGEDYTPAVDRRYLWFDTDDVERLRTRARLPLLVGGEAREYLPVAYRQRARNVDVRAMEPETQQIRGVPIASGRGLTRSDLSHRRRIAILGHDARKELLGAEGGVGSWLRIAGRPFRVVGILERRGTQLSRDGEEIDDQVWIPLTTFQTLWPRWWTPDAWVQSIHYRMRDRTRMEETEREIRAILAESLGVSPTDEEAILAWSPVRMLDQLPLDQTSGLLFVLSCATLVIGGIGTLNMMLDSVQERRQEIGVRLAVGARRRDVLLQFFLETFAVVGIGGLVGIGLGIALSAGLASLEVPDLIPVPVLSVRVVVAALLVMAAVGLGAGVGPAWRASRIDPAITLRMD